MKKTVRAGSSLMAGLVIAALAMPGAVAQDRVVPDTYLAVTTNMDPAQVQLKADVIRWSSADERAAVIAALQSDEPAAALKDLPTMGVVWRENSAVGNSIKYAYRSAADGGERVTLVTEKQIGYTSFKPWMAENPADEVSADYTVIELNVSESGSGMGTMSLGADVSIDSGAALVSLAADGTEPLLTSVRMAPKPYWANAD